MLDLLGMWLQKASCPVWPCQVIITSGAAGVVTGVVAGMIAGRLAAKAAMRTSETPSITKGAGPTRMAS